MGAAVVIHIGLHKTGTRFMQRMVFRQLDPERFLVNPEPMLTRLRRALRQHDDHARVRELETAVQRWRQSGDTRTLVLSEPHASGDMYGGHHGYGSGAALLGRLFPGATILFVVRRPADWLQSAYRQALVKDPGMPIERFLNYRDGAFQPPLARRRDGRRSIDALGLSFLDIYRSYARRFGPRRVYLLRQEDLRRRPRAVHRRVAEALALERLPEPPHERSQNRSFSALAIRLFFPGSWLPALSPRPGRAESDWLRKPLRPLRKLRTNLIRHGFDRLVYVDWDLLERHGMRRRLEDHYREEEGEIERLAAVILDRGPAALDDAGTPERVSVSAD